MNDVIRVRAVALDPARTGGRTHGYIWTCDCHPGLAPTLPWTEQPTESSAWAEHELAVAARGPLLRAEWIR